MENLSLKIRELGYEIKTDSAVDGYGPYNIVTLIKDGKRTRRKGGTYFQALTACADACGLIVNVGQSCSG